jgi:hypothetical protein
MVKLAGENLTGWEVCLDGFVIVVNQRYTSGQISIRISALWICVAFQNIYYYYKAGGQIVLLHISPHWNWRDKKSTN